MEETETSSPSSQPGQEEPSAVVPLVSQDKIDNGPDIEDRRINIESNGTYHGADDDDGDSDAGKTDVCSKPNSGNGEKAATAEDVHTSGVCNGGDSSASRGSNENLLASGDIKLERQDEQEEFESVLAYCDVKMEFDRGNSSGR